MKLTVLSLCVLGGLVVAPLLIPVTVFADEVTDAVNEGLQSYNKGDFSAAATSFDYAAQLVRQKKGGQLQNFLPKPLSGWTAETAASQAAGTALFGGGVTAERKYNKGSAGVTVKIMTDSPLLQGLMMMFSNPAIATSDGAKLETISGQKAIVKYDPANKGGSINVVVANRFLVTAEGDEVSKEDLVSYIKAIDFQKIATLQ